MRTSIGFAFVLLASSLPACVEVELDPDELSGTEARPLTVDVNATYAIVGIGSGKCVEIADGSKRDGARVQLASCNQSLRQLFRFERTEGAYYRVRNAGSDKCLDVSRASAATGTNIIQYVCKDQPNQQWRTEDVAGGAIRVIARHSGLALDVAGGSTAERSAIVQQALAGVTSQQFRMVRTTGSGPGVVPAGAKQVEDLNRGVVAVKTASGVYVGWRLLGSDPSTVAFNVYRGATKVNASPITNSTNLVDPAGTNGALYSVRPVVGGVEQRASEAVGVWNRNFLTIPLQTLEGYTPGDASVGDLDGDGQYEIVIKQEMRPRDNSQGGVTGETLLEAYRMNGTLLWRINLGKNIREGAHYTQLMVYDLDGDGRAEVACKTADGTVDGQGRVLGDPSADHRNAAGYILQGPEYLTIFDGLTGRALATKGFVPARGDVRAWGDAYGNRVDRFLAAIAYLDGQRPSLIMARGYYTRMVITAWDYRGGGLTRTWTFDTDDGMPEYRGQGNHNLSVGDVDGDGRDEIIYGAAAIDDDGTGLYSTGLGHGDALHLTDMDPTRPGLEVFQPHEHASTAGMEYRDAATGRLLFGIPSTGDVGRGLAMDVDPRFPGFEAWGAGGGVSGMYNLPARRKISDRAPAANFGVWWDADPLREILDGSTIGKWNPATSSTSRLLTAYLDGATSNNGTKANPALSADLLGDWREEVIWRHGNNRELLVFTTTDVTDRRIHTLMHDLQYRESVAWQNVGYNQPPHTSFYLGHGMSAPPRPNIYVR